MKLKLDFWPIKYNRQHADDSCLSQGSRVEFLGRQIASIILSGGQEIFLLSPHSVTFSTHYCRPNLGSRNLESKVFDTVLCTLVVNSQQYMQDSHIIVRR